MLGNKLKKKDKDAEDAKKLAEAVEEPKVVEDKPAEKDWEAEAIENLDRWKRCMADFENYKKRQSENLAEMIKYSNQSMILEILPVLDNFHASTNHIPEDQKDNAWVVGIMHIQKQLEKVLTDNGVTEIQVKVGDSFDPNIHEAIHAGSQAEDNSAQSTVQSSEKDEKNHEPLTKNRERITKVILKGYKLNGKVIRAARVIVE